MPFSRGHLNPGTDGVDFERFTLGADTVAAVRHVWVVRWSLAPKRPSIQRVLGYPTCNIVFSRDGAILAGPNRRLFEKTLTGTGWTVGVLLRPAVARMITRTAPMDLVGKTEPLLTAPMDDVAETVEAGSDRNVLKMVLHSWLAPIAALVDARGQLLNEVCRIADEKEDIIRTADLAARVNMSGRSLERLTKEGLGVTPKWLIECRRLQTAATTLFADPATNLSTLAIELGYSDYAHFSRQYRTILGVTPKRDQCPPATACPSASLE
jgi:AraC-like DNA-binding protein